MMKARAPLSSIQSSPACRGTSPLGEGQTTIIILGIKFRRTLWAGHTEGRYTSLSGGERFNELGRFNEEGIRLWTGRAESVRTHGIAMSAETVICPGLISLLKRCIRSVMKPLCKNYFVLRTWQSIIITSKASDGGIALVPHSSSYTKAEALQHNHK